MRMTKLWEERWNASKILAREAADQRDYARMGIYQRASVLALGWLTIYEAFETVRARMGGAR